MKSTVIADSAISVSRLGFGTASLHHLFNATQRQTLLETAASAGITHIDTSPYYGYGLAESDVGAFLRCRRAGFTVATKVGLYPWGAAASNATSVWARKALGKVVPAISLPVVNWRVDQARLSLTRSLKRLQTDYVDFLLLHEPDEKLIDSDEFMRWLEAEVARGTVRSWGLAGVADRVAPWVRAGHPLAKVVQTQDSLDKRQADFMLAYGRSLQFTHGYLSSPTQSDQANAPQMILRKALERNTTGTVIVATRRAERISEFAKLAT